MRLETIEAKKKLKLRYNKRNYKTHKEKTFKKRRTGPQ